MSLFLPLPVCLNIAKKHTDSFYSASCPSSLRLLNNSVCKDVSEENREYRILQVTKDGCPIIFHDNFIYTEEDVSSYFMHSICYIIWSTECQTIRRSYTHLFWFFQGKISQKRVTDLQLEDFVQYGPQNEQGKVINSRAPSRPYEDISNLG